MKIQNNTVATIDYIVTDTENKVLDTTNGQDELQVLIGHGSIVQGLEEALIGHEPGERVDVVVPPEKAYGTRDPSLVQTVDKSLFEGMDLNIGDSFMADTDAGQKAIIVKAIKGDEVVVDGNHPLAGITLKFSVDVIDVREATETEIKHGHVHVNGHCSDHEHDDDCCCHHHHDDDEHECCCHHHDDDDDHECCHHHDEDDDHECCHHHDEDGEHECCHHHDDENK